MLGEYIEIQGALHRLIRVCTQESLHIPPEHKGRQFIVREVLHEFKNCTTGRLYLIVASTEVVDYVGETRESDTTAFVLPRDAVHSAHLRFEKEVRP